MKKYDWSFWLFSILCVIFGASIISTIKVTKQPIVCTVEDAYINDYILGIDDYVIVVSVNNEKVYKVFGMDEYYLFRGLVGEEVNATLKTVQVGFLSDEDIILLEN